MSTAWKWDRELRHLSVFGQAVLCCFRVHCLEEWFCVLLRRVPCCSASCAARLWRRWWSCRCMASTTTRCDPASTLAASASKPSTPRRTLSPSSTPVAGPTTCASLATTGSPLCTPAHSAARSLPPRLNWMLTWPPTARPLLQHPPSLLRCSTRLRLTSASSARNLSARNMRSSCMSPSTCFRRAPPTSASCVRWCSSLRQSCSATS